MRLAARLRQRPINLVAASVTAGGLSFAGASVAQANEEQPPRVVYINLARRRDREQVFLSRNGELLDQAVGNGLIAAWHRLDGADGVKLAADPAQSIRTLCSEGLVTGQRLSPNTNWGQLGCALSHRLAWESAEENCNGGLLVLEDDAVLGPDFALGLKMALASLKELGRECDILYLGFNADATLRGRFLAGPKMDFAIDWVRPESKKRYGHGEVCPTDFYECGTAASNNQVVCQPTELWGLCGYYISPRGAKRLKDACFPLTLAQPGDDYYERRVINIDASMSKQIRCGKVEAYAVLPPLVTSPNDHVTSDTVCGPS